MLLVLTVLGILAGFVVASAAELEAKREEQRFFELLEQDIHYAQSESYARKAATVLVFRAEKPMYEVMFGVNQRVYSRMMPDGIRLKNSSNIREVYFTANGSIRQPGTLRFETKSGERAVIIHLGKGRVAISQ